MASKSRDQKSGISSLPDSRKQYGTSRPKKMAQVAPLQSSAQVPFQSAKLQTRHSSWTPILHKPSNEQMYIERRDLIGHWFDLWTDAQRKRFLRYILNHCKKGQVLFLHKFFNDNVPVTHADFTSILPRFLSLYIFSFLDPRSLCRAGMVCWHWKNLTEQDSIWMPKCVLHGWFLPYTPKRNENGAWKIHYMKCLQTLDVAHPTQMSDLYGRMSDGSRQLMQEQQERRRKMLQAREAEKQATLIWRERPPWLDPDPKPADLAQAHNQMIGSANPDWDPVRTRGHLRSFTEPNTRTFDYGLDSTSRKKHHRATTEFETSFKRDENGMTTLSTKVAEEAADPRGVMDQTWPKLQQSSTFRRRDLSRGGQGDYYSSFQPVTSSSRFGAYKTSSYLPQRLVIIASNVHAYEALVAALKPGVEVLCYDYNSTTIEALLQMVQEIAMEIQPIRSILIVTSGEEAVELTEDIKLTGETLQSPEMRNLWENISMLMGGGAKEAKRHVDFFAPLAATEQGTNLMSQLSRLTGLEVVAPDVICQDKYSHVTSVWSSKPEKASNPSLLYFDEEKLRFWQVLAGRSREAVNKCRKHLGKFFQDKMGYNLVKLTGATILESLGDDAGEIADALVPLVKKAVEALVESGAKPESCVEYVGHYLLNQAGTGQRSVDKGQPPVKSELVQGNAEKGERDSPPRPSTSNVWVNGSNIKFGSDGESIDEEIDEESIAEETDDNMNVTKDADAIPNRTFVLAKSTNKTHQAHPVKVTLPPFQTEEPILTPLNRRAMYCQIVKSEKDYVQKLDVIHDVYYKRLKAALQSNKAITSQPNVDLIFQDVNMIRIIHRDFLEELQTRLTEWSTQQCVGDCFIKLQGKLKAYTNFHNNYPIILSTIDKCREQEPLFRAFLKQVDNTPETHMYNLQELLLQPAWRIAEYVRLLLHQEHCTAVDHADREDLAAAIETFKLLDQKIQKAFNALAVMCKGMEPPLRTYPLKGAGCHQLLALFPPANAEQVKDFAAQITVQERERGEMERCLKAVQLKVTGAPKLLEANRHLIQEEHVAQVRLLQEGANAGSLQHVHDICFFLFNDALMVTTETNHHIAYTREVEIRYRFQAAISLTKLVVEDVPDSQFASNVFILKTPKRQWMCSSKNYSHKLAWITVLEETIKAAMDVD